MRADGARGRDGEATKAQGSRPVLFYVSPSGANSNRSNQIQTQIQTKIQTKTKTKFKPNSNPIETVRTHLEPISNPN